MNEAAYTFPKTIPTVTPEKQKIFWSRVDKSGEIQKHIPEIGNCWNWIGSRLKKGYGRFNINGGEYKAHRISYSINVEEIPISLMVLHKCDNPKCVRPDHLYCGDGHDNMRDMVERGRIRTAAQTARGEAVGAHCLTEINVKIIRQRFHNGERFKELAQEFGVRPNTLRAAALGLTWKHVI